MSGAIGVSVSEVFARVCELASARGARGINHLPGCWEHQVDEQWHVSLNGADEPRKSESGVDVPSFHVYVTFNGWPAGFVNLRDGCIAAGEAANEDELLAALKKAIAAS